MQNCSVKTTGLIRKRPEGTQHNTQNLPSVTRFLKFRNIKIGCSFTHVKYKKYISNTISVVIYLKEGLKFNCEGGPQKVCILWVIVKWWACHPKSEGT